MSEPLTLALACLVGGALGGLFFGGLWWTVRQLPTSKKPALLVFASLILRSAITVAGFYFVSDGQLDRMLICLLGFVMARYLVTHLTKSPEEAELPSKHEASHAP